MASSDRPASARRGSTSVSGPGQKAPASARASASNSASLSAAARSGTCTISGLNAGPALGREDRRDRAVAAGVGPEAVDGLGREGHQLARVQQRRRRAQAAGAVRQGHGVDRRHFWPRARRGDAAFRLSGRPGGPRLPARRRLLISGSGVAREAAMPRRGECHDVSRASDRDALPARRRARRRPAGRNRAFRRGDAGHRRGGPDRGGAPGRGRVRAAAPRRRPASGAAGERRGARDPGLRRGLPRVRRGRLGRHGGRPRARRHGPAGDADDLRRRDDLGRQPGAVALPAAQPGPDRGAGAPCRRRAQGALPARS